AAVLGVYWWMMQAGRAEGETRAAAFAAIVLANLALILASRSPERSLLQSLATPNPALWWIVGGTLAALAGAIYVPAAAQLFRFVPLSPADLALAAGAGIA